MTTATQVYENTFELTRDGAKLSVFISRNPIGGGEYTYSVRYGDARQAKGKALTRGFETRKQAVEWVNKNIK